MRFIFAIFAFIGAILFVGLGVAQRTVFLPPSTVSAESTQASPSPYLLISDDVLHAVAGSQTLSLSGSKKVFAAYGRTGDVQAWLTGVRYDKIGYNQENHSLTSTTVNPPADAVAPAVGSENPTGSDLWFEEYSAENSLARTFTLPPGYSLIIASDGSAPAPTTVGLSWPQSNSTPLAGPLLVAGCVFLLLGLVLLVLGLVHAKRSRGPRRKPPALPTGTPKKAIKASHSRRRKSSMVFAPIAVLSCVALSGCSSEYWPQFSADSLIPTATPTPTLAANTADQVAREPVVTEAQFTRILEKISETTTQADTASNADVLATRFEGPAFDLRKSNYGIRASFPSYPAPQAIPNNPPSLVLPQATDVWPRTVFAIVKNSADATVAPLSLMLVQETPRTNYKVYYAIPLEPQTTVPPVASAANGTARLAPDTKLLSMTPDAAAAGYADLLSVGSQSPTFAKFEATGDTLRTSVGVDYKTAQKANLPSTASITFGKAAAPGQSIALATIQSGAIVAVNVRESEVVKPVQTGATVSPEGAVKAASGVTRTAKGTEAIYDYQLLFYVPSAEDNSPVRLLGFAQGLLSAKELP